MRFSIKIALAIIIIFLGIQFIKPPRNYSTSIASSDISMVLDMPDSIKVILTNACYDCHSNNTRYPWYSNIQPVGWLLAYDIKKGKEELNFSEFGAYSQRRQVSKLNGIANSIEGNIMPLKSYRIMHKPARLSVDEKSALINWSQKVIDRTEQK